MKRVSTWRSFRWIFLGLVLLNVGSAIAEEKASLPEGSMTIEVTQSDQVVVEGVWKMAAGEGLGVAKTLARERKDISRKSVTFRPIVGKTGFYTLWLGLPKAYRSETAVPIRVSDAKGEFSFAFNTETASPVWVPVAEVEITPDKSLEVRIDDPGRLMPVFVGGIRLTPVAVTQSFPEPVIPSEAKAVDKFEKVLFKMLANKIPAHIQNEKNPLMRNTLAARAAAASVLWRTMERSPERTGLWADTECKHESAMEGRRVYYELLRLCDLMYAYYSPYTPASFEMRGNPQVVNEVKKALDWIVDNNRFSAKLKNTLGGAWYDFEIGNPRSINALLTALYPFITRQDIEKHLASSLKFMTDPRKKYGGSSDSSAASRIHLCEVQMGRGLLLKNEEMVADGRKAALEAFAFKDRAQVKIGGRGAEGSNGMYRDGSWIEHDIVAYNWGYGIGFMESVVDFAADFAGTPWQVQFSEIKSAYDFYFLGMEPFWTGGYLYPGTIGRALGQQKAQEPNGQLLALAAGLLESAGPEIEKPLQLSLERSFAAIQPLGGLERVASRIPPTTLDRMLTRLSGKDTAQNPGIIFSNVYHNMDRVMHHRPGYYAGLSMTSSRIANTETIFGCNLHGWYTGHGMLAVVDKAEPDRFSHNYWALVDPYRLPGVTLDKRAAPPGSQDGKNSGSVNTKDWVGGAVLDRRYSVAGMDLQIKWSPLQAKKSWFFFDDQILALGSGISSPDPEEVETIIDNVLVDAIPDSLMVDGKTVSLVQGKKVDLTSVRWLHLPGNGKGKGMGVVFSEASKVSALAETRSGSWKDVFVRGDATPITRSFLALFLPHGKQPRNASYAYSLLPGTDSLQTGRVSESNPVEILAQTETIHAARHAGLGITAANFYAAGKFSGYEVDRSCSMIIREKTDTIQIGISDPTMKEAGPVTLRAEMTARKLRSADAGMEVVSLSPLVIKAKTAQSGGKTLVIELEK